MDSALNVKMAHLNMSPLPDLLDLGAIYYRFDFDKIAQFNDPRITARHAADELDLFARWSPNDWLGLTGIFGFAIPGPSLKQAAQAFVADNGPGRADLGDQVLGSN